MRRHCARLTAAATLTLVFSLAPATQKPGPEFDAPTRTTPPLSPHAAKGVQYENVTASSGLSRFSHVAGDPLKPYLPETIGSGVALFDHDNDGWLDIYLVNALSSPARKGQAAAQSSALFRNNKDGTFTEITLKAGVGNNRWGTGVCAGDFDNDGWADLYVTNLGRSRLYRNNKDGTFADVAEKAGVAVETWSTGCAFGDYDRDGQLDLYVAGYVQFDWNDPPPAGESSDAPVAASPLVTAVDQGARMGAAYDSGAPFCTFLGLRVACGPRGLKGAPDFLFRNNGDGTFTNTTRRAASRTATATTDSAWHGWTLTMIDGWISWWRTTPGPITSITTAVTAPSRRSACSPGWPPTAKDENKPIWGWPSATTTGMAE